MFCEKCGAQLEQDSKFCLNCGAPATPQASCEDTSVAAPAASRFFSKKKNVVILAIAAAVLVVGILAAIVIFSLPTTIYIDDFITVAYDGLSTQGTAQLEFDSDAFEARLLQEMSRQEMRAMMIRIQHSESILELDKTSGLTNGDKLRIRFSFDNETAKDYGVQIKLKQNTITVTELQEPIFLDLFAELKLVFTGCSPYAQVEIENNINNPFIQDHVRYSLTNNYDLEEGEKFTVKASFSDSDASAAGYIILESEKEYTATNLPQPAVLNPFDYVTVTFTGLEGNGKLSYQKTGDIDFMRYISFASDKTSSLVEGDIITLTYTVSDNQDPLKYGYKLAEVTDKQYTVPQLGKHLTNFSDLTAAEQQKIMDKATEVAKLYLTKESGDNKTGSVSLTGTGYSRRNQLSYATDLSNVKLQSVIACQDSPYSWHTKYLYFFFTVDIAGHPNVKGGDTTGAFFLRIANPIVHADGTLEIDFDNGYTFSASSYVYLDMDAMTTAMQNSMYHLATYTPSN